VLILGVCCSDSLSESSLSDCEGVDGGVGVYRITGISSSEVWSKLRDCSAWVILLHN